MTRSCNALEQVLMSGLAHAGFRAVVASASQHGVVLHVESRNFEITWAGQRTYLWELHEPGLPAEPLSSTSAVLSAVRARLDPDFRPAQPRIAAPPLRPQT